MPDSLPSHHHNQPPSGDAQYGDLRQVIVIGGGLAGMAAAVKLRKHGYVVRLLEAKRKLGGRAGSYIDPVTGESIDYCQHVGLGCCTQLITFLEELDLYQYWKRERTLNFCGAHGERISFTASKWTPAPLHLWPLLNAWPGLKLRHRVQIGWAISKLYLMSERQAKSYGNVLPWLQAHRQSPEVIERFWTAILVSALGDEIDRVALSAARKVILDGFVRDAKGYELLVPQLSLSEIFGEIGHQRLLDLGIQIDLQTPVKSITWSEGGSTKLLLGSGETVETKNIVCAVPWFRLGSLIDQKSDASELRCQGEFSEICQIAKDVKGAPITGCHLWFDKSWLDEDQVAIIGRLCQWVFQRPDLSPTSSAEKSAYYYQVVISGSRQLPSDSQAAIQDILNDLREIFPRVRDANLLKGKLVTDPLSVYSLDAQTDRQRPAAGQAIGKMYLAGDWTQTGWPATMEGAIRSGIAAAENCIAELQV